ncbi:hypothetical protein GY45DRAFT_1326578 [Cubamyces sp. BRFM 1775]|nr:hypothetical protein GY45DRAFT_1326578 [Cubamyces sp. BRFM 1775]
MQYWAAGESTPSLEERSWVLQRNTSACMQERKEKVHDRERRKTHTDDIIIHPMSKSGSKR